MVVIWFFHLSKKLLRLFNANLYPILWIYHFLFIQSSAGRHLDWFMATMNSTSQVVPVVKKKKKPACQCRRCKRCRFDPWVGKIPWRRGRLPTQYSCLENEWTQEPGRLQFIGSQRVGHDRSDWACTHAWQVYVKLKKPPNCCAILPFHQLCVGFPIFPYLADIWYYLFDYSHSRERVMVSRSRNLHSSDDESDQMFSWVQIFECLSWWNV